MKFGVVVFPGSNCDRDMIHALRNEMNQEVIPLWHKDKDLSMFTKEDCIVLPGGFSYGDYLRCGAIARFSPMMQSVIDFANEGGRVLGVCNGFQILCESGLLPGVLLQNANAHDDHAPNGSLNGIAGICNKERNIFGMMPHPERASSYHLGNIAGRKIFDELLNVN